LNISLTPFEIGLIFAALVLLALAYVREGVRLWKEGGAVRSEGFTPTDLFVAIVVASYFVLVATAAAKAKTVAPIKIDRVLPNELFFLSIALGIVAFLVLRGANVIEAFGLRRVSALRAAGLALFFYLGVMPIVTLINYFTVQALGGGAEEQELVLLFQSEAHKGNYAGVAVLLLAGVALAPVAEEILFRGFLYGVLKRYLGGIGAALLSAMLFAAIHMNLASLPGLFVLALGLIFAYERSGSIFVPMGVHALFNFCNFALLYVAAQAKHL
jgi:membrane protease YdiL (CAAX protease family)